MELTQEKFGFTKERKMGTRGSLWLGQTCNLRCKFCYYSEKVSDYKHPEHKFISIDKAKQICKTMKEFYGNTAVDIEGGEPTIYPEILELVSYCKEIGLKPTLITNAIALNDIEKCKQLKDAGVDDFLVSIHALGKSYDEIVRMEGASIRQMQALDNLIQLKIPFRVNTVLSMEAIPQLMDIAEISVKKGAKVFNFIAFNPFIDQSTGNRAIETIPKYSEIVKKIIPVIDYLDSNNIEVNVRYLPMCVFEEKYRKFVQDFQQTIYDNHEWECASESWSSLREQRVADKPLSEPKSLEEIVMSLRNTYFGKIKDTDLNKKPFEEIIKLISDKYQNKESLDFCIFGNSTIGLQFIEELKNSNINRQMKGFISSKEYLRGENLLGYPWYSDDWLENNPVDIILVASPSAEIKKILEDKNLTDKCIFIFDNEMNEKWEKKFYLKELGEVENFTDKEYLYKEYRVLMTKFLHPYSKGEKCEKCSLVGICDGFHRDYAQIYGFDEARVIKSDKTVYNPRFYINEQLKVR
ncbi:MAG: radical SAM protein [Candidatus Gastranaerophilales bacterium]|nr:radical SAM protein [Candidatus Gastranaerophilales bacterium]